MQWQQLGNFENITSSSPRTFVGRNSPAAAYFCITTIDKKDIDARHFLPLRAAKQHSLAGGSQPALSEPSQFYREGELRSHPAGRAAQGSPQHRRTGGCLLLLTVLGAARKVSSCRAAPGELKTPPPFKQRAMRRNALRLLRPTRSAPGGLEAPLHPKQRAMRRNALRLLRPTRTTRTTLIAPYRIFHLKGGRS